MALDKYLIGIVIFALVIVIGVLAVADVDNNYNDFNVSQSSNDSFHNLSVKAENMITNTYETSNRSSSKIIGSETKVDDDNVFDSMLKGAWSSLRLLGNSFGLIDETAGVVQNELGILPIFRTILFIVITITIIFGIIFILFRLGRG